MHKMNKAILLFYLAIMLSAALWSPLSSAKTDDLGRVRVLFLGATAVRSIMQADPTLEVYSVPAYLYGMGSERVRRSLRLYMPRTYAKLTGCFDVIYLCDSGAQSYAPTWLKWMADAVRVDGLGFVMSGGEESFAGHITYPSWGDTLVGDILPVYCFPQLPALTSISTFFRMVVVKPDDPLMASLPFEKAPGFHIINREVSPKEASTTLAVATLPDRNPVAVVMEVGKGRSLAFMPYLANPSPNIVPLAGWEFYVDFICNLMIYPAQAPLPSDYLKTHILRSKISGYSSLRTTVIDILSFVDAFGANTAEADALIGVADNKMAEARALFIRKDLDESEKLIDEGFEDLKQAQTVAMKAKDRALFWIYTVEWLAVIATTLICGFVLWTLMVRRKLYTEVASTRLGQGDFDG